MDPNANLAEQRRIVARLFKDDYSGSASRRVLERDQDGMRLAELVQALDEWITKGGFLPASWGAHWRGVRS